MDEMSIKDYVELLSVFTTAFATIALVYFTRTLAIETRHLAERSSQAHIVATIEPNQWAMNHVDVRISNTGNATAYDVKVAFSPALASDDEKSAPLSAISVLKPNQDLSSYLVEYAKVKEQSFDVVVTWRASPSAKAIERNSYTFSMKQYEGIVRLGASSPMIQLAEQVKKIREDLRHVASGSRKLKVETYTSADRSDERRELIKWRDSLRSAQQSSQTTERQPADKNSEAQSPDNPEAT
jgi:hypothetical protein